MDKELQKVLKAREERWKMRKLLVEKWQSCLVTVTLCVPVKFRTSNEFRIIFRKLCSSFKELLVTKGEALSFESFLQSDDGPAFFIIINNEAEEIKRICVEAEELIPGGRMLDIDVMNSCGVPVGRNDIGLPSRKCFICEKPAAICVSRKLHSPEETYSRVEQFKAEVNYPLFSMIAAKKVL